MYPPSIDQDFVEQQTRKQQKNLYRSRGLDFNKYMKESDSMNRISIHLFPNTRKRLDCLSTDMLTKYICNLMDSALLYLTHLI
ncbi:hypothetical protein BCV73_17205 [Paenibacillus sp. SSG-1]|nr:hypothetical protein BCV73_17205 [Paenibacillus sp. SSG-1]